MRKLVLVSLLPFAIGCKGKPKHQTAPVTVEVPSGSAPDLTLPHGTGGPPAKSTKPVDITVFDKLAAMKFPGFTLERRGNPKVLELRQLTNDHPKILVDAVIQPCDDCTPMDLPRWQAKNEQLKEFLIPELRAAPDTVFEVGQTDLHGQPMIYTYQLGQKMKSDGGGAYSDMYVLYYNDGVNQVRLDAHYVDDPVKSMEALSSLASKADLEKVAKAFMEVYTQAW